MSLRPGSFVAGRYRVTRMLGKGSMGEVWEAVHKLTERSVALKVLVEETSSAEARARILREARACGRIQHRNVIEVFDIAETEDGRPFLVMPLLTGETLEQRLDSRGPLSEDEAIQLGLGIARALVAAHDLGIVHRDLKPGNVFLHWDRGASEPTVKVLDFGISKILSRDEASFTDAGRAMGSPAYMSPEQARGEPDIDARTDIWSFGVLVYEALTGSLPFPGETSYAIVGHILHGVMPDFDALLPHVRPSIRDLLRRCVARDRQARMPTSRDLLGWLEAIQGRTEPPPRPAWTSPPRPSVREPTPATATASALVTQKVITPRARSRGRLLFVLGAVLAGGALGALGVLYVVQPRTPETPAAAAAVASEAAAPRPEVDEGAAEEPPRPATPSASAMPEPPATTAASANPAEPAQAPVKSRLRPTTAPKPAKKSALPDSPG